MTGPSRAVATKGGLAAAVDAASPTRPASMGNQARLRRLAQNGLPQTSEAGAPAAPQSGLLIGDRDDPLEREADQVADRVMQAQASKIDPAATGLRLSRKCSACEEEDRPKVGASWVDPTAAPIKISRKCSACEEDEKPKLRAKPTGAPTAGDGEAAPASVREVLDSPGRALDPALRDFFEPRFGADLGTVRLHVDSQAGNSAREIGALAYAVDEHVAVDPAHYRPSTDDGRRLLAHELTHVLQQRDGVRTLRRRAANCPAKAPDPPTINTMDDFIGLVQRVEASAPAGTDAIAIAIAIAIAQVIGRTKYDGAAWDWLLPSGKGKPGASVGGGVTADDIGALCFKLIVSLPGGGMEDPMHVIAAILADAETQAAGTGATGLSRLVQALPASVSQRGASTWVGDVGKAAAEWQVVIPLPKGGYGKPDYMEANAAPHDLMADIDGVAMTSKSPASGFAFDKTKPLSDNLRRFFSPAKGTGRERRFHTFCSAEGLALETDGVSLSAGAKTAIGQKVKDFADWYAKNDPEIIKWLALMADTYAKQWMARAGDWQWFADQFIDFVQKGLTAEGA